MSNQNNNNQQGKKQPMYIEITQPEKFEKLASSSMETTQKLAKRINKLFTSAFVDYYGCIIYNTSGNGNTNPNQQFMVELHFKPLSAGAVNANDNRVRAFAPIDENVGNNSDIVSGLKAIYGSYRTSSKFKMTKEASEILSEFMFTGANIDPFNPASYDNCKAEYVNSQAFGNGPVMIRVINLDLLKLIKKIYGNKNDDGKRVDYGIIPYGPVTPNINNAMVQNNANWKVIIMQVEAEKMFDLASEMGLIPAGSGSGSIVTGF